MKNLEKVPTTQILIIKKLCCYIFRKLGNFHYQTGAQVIQSCMNRAGHGIMQPMNPYFATIFFPASIMLRKEENIGFCRISQLGNNGFNGLFLNVSLELGDGDEDLIEPREKMKFLQSGEWKQYFKFLIVMHPFLRLVSAFRNRLKPQSG